MVEGIFAFLLRPNQRALICMGMGAPESSSTNEQIKICYDSVFLRTEAYWFLDRQRKGNRSTSPGVCLSMSSAFPCRSLVLRPVRLGGCSHGDVPHWDVMLRFCNMKNSSGSLGLKGLFSWTLNWCVITDSYPEELLTGAEWKRDCKSQRSGQSKEWFHGRAWTRTQVTWTPVPIH